MVIMELVCEIQNCVYFDELVKMVVLHIVGNSCRFNRQLQTLQIRKWSEPLVGRY